MCSSSSFLFIKVSNGDFGIQRTSCAHALEGFPGFFVLFILVFILTSLFDGFILSEFINCMCPSCMF